MRAAGLCHSDLSVIDGNRPRPVPMVLGHEGAGVVEEIGAGVSGSCGWRPRGHGFRAQLPAIARPAMMAGRRCANLVSQATRPARCYRARAGCIDAAPICSITWASPRFADYATVSRRSLIRVDRSLSFEQAAIFGCAVITGTGAVINTARLPTERSVAIIGLGGVGLAALLGARYRSASQIVAVDLAPAKLALARELGATHAFNGADPGVVEAIRDATHGGVEYAFEMAGAAKAMDLAYRITRRGGTTITAGLPHPERGIQRAARQPRRRRAHGQGQLSGQLRAGARHSTVYRVVPGRTPARGPPAQSGTMPLEGINGGFDQLAAGRGAASDGDFLSCRSGASLPRAAWTLPR
jgi:alcohol dehydrogenase